MARRASRDRSRAVDLTRYRTIIPEWDQFVGAAGRPEPTVIRVRTGRISEPELCRRLERQGFRLRAVPGLPGFFEVPEGPRPVSMTLEHWHGLLYVQQASTGVAAPALAAQPGERVLDLCSAPGGKTTHLAEMMGDRGCLVANEIDERRIRGLLGNVYRLGHTNIVVVAGDGRTFPEGALFDRVLVDAPCSGEGTLRRRAGQPPDQSASFLGYVTAAQRALLEKAIRLTRPGGTILYVTCTFAPEENEAVVSDVLDRLPVELEPLDLSMPHAPGITSFGDDAYDSRLVGAARIYPHHLDSGGLFMAKLRRLSETGEDSVRTGAGGWTRVPCRFPGDEGSEAACRDQVEGAVTTIRERYGVDAAGHPEWGWILRGGRMWLQTAAEWPVRAWAPEAWRVVSVGQRAVEFDSRGRPRPTNDFLRLAGDDVRTGVVELSTGGLRNLLERATVRTDLELRGPAALRYGSDVIGRGRITEEGLVSEVPKARAADLKRVLALAEDQPATE